MPTATYTQLPGKLDGDDVVFDQVEDHVELIEVPFLTPEGDPNWTAVDDAGHSHVPQTYRDAGGVERVRDYPSLEDRDGPAEWCEDCRDEHAPFLGYFCRQCGEQVTPATRPPRSPMVIEGERRLTAVVARFLVNGSEHEVEVLGARYTVMVARNELSVDVLGRSWLVATKALD